MRPCLALARIVMGTAAADHGSGEGDRQEPVEAHSASEPEMRVCETDPAHGARYLSRTGHTAGGRLRVEEREGLDHVSHQPVSRDREK